MKNDNFKIKGRNPALALLACSIVSGGAAGLEIIKNVKTEKVFNEYDEEKLRKAAEKRQRKAIKCIHQGDSKKNS